MSAVASLPVAAALGIFEGLSDVFSGVIAASLKL